MNGNYKSHQVLLYFRGELDVHRSWKLLPSDKYYYVHSRPLKGLGTKLCFRRQMLGFPSHSLTFSNERLGRLGGKKWFQNKQYCAGSAAYHWAQSSQVRFSSGYINNQNPEGLQTEISIV